MPLRATFGSRLNPNYVDQACFDVLWALASLPPASVSRKEDMIEFKILRRFIQRPDIENGTYYFTCDPCGNAYPKIVQHFGSPIQYTLPEAFNAERFDRVTIQRYFVHHRHFLLRPQEEISYPFDDATVYTKRDVVDLIYNGHKYRVEFRTAWKFPSRDEDWNLHCTVPMRECFITTPNDSMEDLLEVIDQCTPRSFGSYTEQGCLPPQ